MTKFDLRKAILENKATFHSSLKEDMGLTPFQQEIYDFEEEISGEDFAAEEIDNIRGLNNIDDVENYYANYRGWEDDNSLNGILRDLIRGLAKQFPDLAEVKSSLNEGQFSWFTQDTDQQIGSEPENTLRAVYMFDNKGNKWLEKNYEGYGDFGGKDYYELLAQMNGMANPDRSEGISLAFSGKKGILYPALVTNPNFNWKMHDFTEEAKHDPDQSWYAGEEDEDEYIMGDRDDEYLEEGDTEFQRVAKGKKNKVAKNKGEEDVYGAGVKKGEEIEKKKLKVSELKAKIKEMVLSEMTIDVDDMENAPESEVDFLSEIEAMLAEADEFETAKPARIAEFLKALDLLLYDEYHAELYDSKEVKQAYDLLVKAVKKLGNLNEADEEVDAEVTDTETADAELETPEGTEDVEVTDTMTTAEVDPNVKSVQDALTQAQAAAEQLGDKKLMDQIGNTITFFTRTHVVEKPGLAEGDEKESSMKIKEVTFPMWTKLNK
jgi:hypothetical protein